MEDDNDTIDREKRGKGNKGCLFKQLGHRSLSKNAKDYKKRKLFRFASRQL